MLILFLIQTNAIIQITKNQLNNSCFTIYYMPFKYIKNALKKDREPVYLQ